MAVDWDAYIESMLEQSGGPRSRKFYRPLQPGPRQPPAPEEPGIGGKVLTGLGEALGWAKRRVDIASNYYANDYLRNRVLSGEEPVPTGQLMKEALIAPPDATMSKGEQYARTIGRGVTERTTDILTDPLAMGLMGGGRYIAGKFAGNLAKSRILGARLVPRALERPLPGIGVSPLHGGFMAMMAHGMYEGGQKAYAKYREEGFSPGVAEELAKVGVDAGLISAPFLVRGARRLTRPRPVTETGFELMPEEGVGMPGRKGFEMLPEGPPGPRPRMPGVRPRPEFSEETGFELMPEPTGFEMMPERVAMPGRKGFDLKAEETGFEMRPEPGVGMPGRKGFEMMPEETGFDLVPEGPGGALVPMKPKVPTPTSGEGMPRTSRLSRANVSSKPERANLDAHESLLREIDNQLRVAAGEGNALEAARLIRLRESIRESAWQSQPGAAARLREPYEKPGVVHEVVQQPQNRPRMMEIRNELERHLEEATNPVDRAKVRAAISTLDAQLRQNPIPEPPPPTPPTPPGAPGAPRALPPGMPPPEGAAPPPGAPPPPGMPPGPPGAPPALPGPAPGAVVPASGARMAGAVGEPAAVAATRGAEMRQAIPGMVEAANARVAGLPEGMPPALPADVGPAGPTAVTGPVRDIGGRGGPPGPPPAAMPMLPETVPPGPPPAPAGAAAALPAGPAPPLALPAPTVRPPRAGVPEIAPEGPGGWPAERARIERGEARPPYEPPIPEAEATAIRERAQRYRAEREAAEAAAEVPPPERAPKPWSEEMRERVSRPVEQPEIDAGVEVLNQAVRQKAADRGLTRAQIAELGPELGLSEPQMHQVLQRAVERGEMASELRWHRDATGKKVQELLYYDPTPFYEVAPGLPKSPRPRSRDLKWSEETRDGSLPENTIDPGGTEAKTYNKGWDADQQRAYEEAKAAVEADPEWYVQEYARRNTKNGQIVINPDLARELFPIYEKSNANRTKFTAPIHEAASYVTKLVYNRALDTPTPQHKASTTFFTAGGPGSGKSAIGGLLNGEYASADIVVDGTLARLAQRTIEKAFVPAWRSGRAVHVGAIAPVNPGKYDIYGLESGLPNVWGRILRRAQKTGRVVRSEFALQAHSQNGAPGQILWMKQNRAAIRQAFEEATGTKFRDEVARVDVLDGSEKPIGYTAEGDPIFPPGARLPEELALARLREINYDREVMQDAFTRKAEELVRAGEVTAGVAEQSATPVQPEAVRPVHRRGLGEAEGVAGEGRAAPLRGPPGAPGRPGEVARAQALEHLRADPRGRITSADLVEAGIPKGDAVRAIRNLEVEGLVAFNRARLDYRLTAKGRTQAAEAPTEPAPAPEEPLPPTEEPPPPPPPAEAPPTPKPPKPPTEKVAERPTEVPEAEAGREVRSVAMWKPKKMSPTAFSKSGGYPRQIVTAKAMGDDWHGTGHMLLRAPAPKAGRVLERIADDKMVSAVEGQVKAATKLAEPVAVEKYGDRGAEGVWLKLADGGEVLVDSKLFGHAQRTFPKSDLTWFGSKSDGGIVAYIGKGLEKPGKHPVAVLMPMDAKGATLPTVIEGAGLTAPGKPVRGKKYMAYREPAAMSAETKADVAKQIQAAWERGKTSLTVKADGTSFKLADPNAMQRMHKTVTGKPVPGSEKAGFLLEPGGEPLPAMVTPEKLRTLGSVGPTTTALKPAGLKTVGMDAVKQARTIYKDPFHAWDALEKSVEAAQRNKQPINYQVHEAIDAMKTEAAKKLGLDKVPESGPELVKFEADAAKRIAEARAAARKGERGAVTVDLLTWPAQLVRDAIVLGARAVRQGATSLPKFSAQMGRVLGGGVKGLKDLWRWVQSFFGTERPPGPAVPPRPGRGAPPRPPEVPAADVPPTPPGPRGPRLEPGIGRRGRPIKPPTKVEVERASEFEGPLRPGEKPATTDYPVNMERINTAKDVKDVEHRLVEGFKERLQQNREHRDWDTAHLRAVESGLNKTQFERLVKERGTVTDAEMDAGRILREEAGVLAAQKIKAHEAMKRSETSTPEEINRAYEERLEAVARFGSITAHTTAAAAETGRALSILRRFSQELSPEERFYQQAVKYGMSKGTDPRLMTELADAVLGKDHAKIAEIGRKVMKPGFMDKVSEFFINNILSAPPTPAANVLGNWGHENMLRTPERWIAGVIETGAAKRAGRVPERLPQEAFEALKANWRAGFGFTKGSVQTMTRDILKENPWDPELAGIKGEFRPPALGGKVGKLWRTPMRTLRALDKAARQSAYEAQVAAEVYRDAFNSARARGLTGEALKQYMEPHSASLLKDLSRWREIDVKRRINGEKSLTESEKKTYYSEKLNKIGRSAEHAARTSTFQDLPGSFTRAALRLRNTHPWLTLFVPFIATPSRILSQAMKRTPFGLARAARRLAKGETRGGQAADELAAGIWGTMLSAGLYGLAESGFITGSGPTDPKEKSLWRKAGKEPYAVNIGGTWVSMARLEPMATVLGLAADLSEATNEKKAGDIADKLMAAATNNIMSKTYLEGVSSLIEAVEDPERYGSTFAKKFVGSVAVPNIVAAAARATDPYVRETAPVESKIPGLGYVLPTIKSRIPGVSRTLPKMRYGTGEPIKREESPLSLMLSPIRYRREKGKEAELERLMLDIGYAPSKPPKSVVIPRSGGRRGTLTQRERDVFARYMRQATRQARRLAASASFKRADPIAQEKLLKKLYRDARDRANDIVMGGVIRRARAGR